MKNNFVVTALIFFGLLLLAACQPGETVPPAVETVVEEIQPTATPTPPAEMPPPETAALEDDFSDNHNQWTTFATDAEGNSIAVENGVYNIHAVFNEDVAEGFEVPIWGWAPSFQFLNFDLRVEATKVSGPDNSEIFFIFGATDDQNFHEFTYSSLGNRVVVGQSSGSIEVGEFVFSAGEGKTIAAINTGNATNEVRLVVVDGELSVYINGEQRLDTFELVDAAGEYAGGFIGFGCAPFEPGEILCTFDNLEVFEL